MDIICGDGGGVRGWMGLSCWETLRHNKYSVNGTIFKPQAYVGTSAWGMIAIALAQGQNPGYLLSMAPELSDQIFHRSLFRVLNPLIAKYGSSGRLKAVQSIIRESLPTDKPWGVTAAPYFQRAAFGMMTDNILLTERDCSPVDAAMRTSAAPTFFPAWQGWIDGAFEDNNPVVEAVLFAEKLAPGQHHRILSFGCGRTKNSALRGNGDWGIPQWVPRLASAFMDEDNMRSEAELRDKFPGISYTIVRFQYDLPEEVAMDDATMVPDFIQWGRKMADEKYSYAIRSSK